MSFSIRRRDTLALQDGVATGHVAPIAVRDVKGDHARRSGNMRELI